MEREEIFTFFFCTFFEILHKNIKVYILIQTLKRSNNSNRKQRSNNCNNNSQQKNKGGY